MRLQLIRGGLASTPPGAMIDDESDGFSGAFIRRPDRPPPPVEPTSQLPVVVLTVLLTASALLSFFL